MCCHVNDIVWGGCVNIERNIKTLKETFLVSLQEFEIFKYLGLYIEQKDNIIRVNPILYICKLTDCIFDKSCKDMQNAKLRLKLST